MIRQAMLWEKEEGGTVRCGLCSHRCLIAEGKFGLCGMRRCVKGELVTFAFGEVVASHVDPVEKKPLYHFLPGTMTFSMAAMGCNFTCSFCQNWRISTLSASKGDSDGYELKPEEAVRQAVLSDCASVSYTYTEPTVFFEYAYETAREAHIKGLKNIFVTNGYMTMSAIDVMSGYIDAANIDLKFFDDGKYRKVCGASLSPVLRSIEKMKVSGIWVEVTTLVIPGLNDSLDELRSMARFLAGLDREMPWHISRFHPDYKAMKVPPTDKGLIAEVVEIGKEEGLKHVYPGNADMPADTLCPGCGKLLIRRNGYCLDIEDDSFDRGRCLSCGSKVAGVWI